MRKYLLFLLLTFNATLSAKQFTVNTVPNPKTVDADNFVCNPDYILGAPAVEEINRILQSLEEEATAEVAVVMLNSIGDDEDIVDFGVKLFEK
jgi:uncharacterized protein